MAAADESLPFEVASSFEGARPGKVFKLGDLGLGYYVDALAGSSSSRSSSGSTSGNSAHLEEFRKQLPETWRNCTSLREERLRVDKKAGAGLALERSDFGFAVTGVDAEPGQQVQQGEVIVAVEGRMLHGLSAPQMQASFLKRRVDGARLQVAALAEVEYLSKLDPAVVECWDAQHQRHYYFHKKTGQSGWTHEELSTSASSSSEGAGDGTESDLAREERERWNAWNAGERGGYTEQFLDKYKNCQSNPSKPKETKILKGSVGPGNGMEYMARWTGSKNSFN
eukprot:CAMPEP_0177418586 /NCGR_PEP_ID=MMETSP0368-20130122/69259_1 /TAXON_ID=447022 ORGANISM="Scrippsiella hangoei-like, Strain SHHI-4" /NCGR_SAMPLE_ID=MMETSP0368 /ASSEMBLY_ACC=CAM_ASM_000363 /LENGTH=281 /DNA_ID=CAMNT_0018888237 /DNA_START=68 /DNA_END=913 /DNA_ORIENTATION=+